MASCQLNCITFGDFFRGLLGILALAASGGACAQPTPTPQPTNLYPLLECLIEVDAWIDWNGNGRRDPEDGPLDGVAFRMEWSKCDDGSYQVRTWTSDASRHYVTYLPSCECLNYVIRAEAPPGYRRTTISTPKAQ